MKKLRLIGPIFFPQEDEWICGQKYWEAAHTQECNLMPELAHANQLLSHLCLWPGFWFVVSRSGWESYPVVFFLPLCMKVYLNPNACNSYSTDGFLKQLLIRQHSHLTKCTAKTRSCWTKKDLISFSWLYTAQAQLQKMSFHFSMIMVDGCEVKHTEST